MASSLEPLHTTTPCDATKSGFVVDDPVPALIVTFEPLHTTTLFDATKASSPLDDSVSSLTTLGVLLVLADFLTRADAGAGAAEHVTIKERKSS